MRRAVLILCLLWTAIPAAAEKWTYAESEHFEVYTTGGDRAARDALTHFERVHAFFSVVFRQTPKPAARTRLIVFTGEKQFKPYRPTESAAAFYLAGADRDYIVMERLDDESMPIAIHEYTHLFIQHAGARFPVWLNEGLAEFYSTMQPEGGSMSVGRVPLDRLMYLRLAGVPLIGIERLLAIDHDSPEYSSRQHTGVFYSQSWALTHMLRIDDRYRPRWDQFLGQVASGVPAAEALTKTYGKSLQAIRSDLQNYITRDNFLYYADVAKVPQSKARYTTRPVEPFEAGLVTANLLASSPTGEDEARASFVALEKQKPGDLGLLESRGYFELRRGERDVAASYFDRAVAAGSRNGKLYRDYARLQPEQAPTLLARAMALAPDDPDVLTDYASVLLNNRQPAEALQTLRGIVPLPPAHTFRVLSLMSYAYLSMDQLAEARTVAQGAASFAEAGRETEYVQRLMTSIDQYETRKNDAEQRARLLADLQRRSTRPVEVPSSDEGGTDEGGPVRRTASGTVRDPSITTAAPVRLIGEPGTVTMKGRLRNVTCSGEEAILEVMAGDQMLRLLIDNPAAVSVLGVREQMVSLQCGSQDTPLTVRYRATPDERRKTVGIVQILDYTR